MFWSLEIMFHAEIISLEELRIITLTWNNDRTSGVYTLRIIKRIWYMERWTSVAGSFMLFIVNSSQATCSGRILCIILRIRGMCTESVMTSSESVDNWISELIILTVCDSNNEYWDHHRIHCLLSVFIMQLIIYNNINISSLISGILRNFAQNKTF